MATECANRSHSAAFPRSLPNWFIRLFTDHRDVVLDPFIGSGTTAFAALELGRKAIGIEINEEFCNAIEAALRQPVQPKIPDSQRILAQERAHGSQLTALAQSL